jgi:hypothetical protein
VISIKVKSCADLIQPMDGRFGLTLHTVNMCDAIGERMIHIDVSKRFDVKGHPHIARFYVQTSTDGAGWKTQYTVETQYNYGMESEEIAEGRAKDKAENIARIMGNAWTYAGVEWRGTSGGYNL